MAAESHTDDPIGPEDVSEKDQMAETQAQLEEWKRVVAVRRLALRQEQSANREEGQERVRLFLDMKEKVQQLQREVSLLLSEPVATSESLDSLLDE